MRLTRVFAALCFGLLLAPSGQAAELQNPSPNPPKIAPASDEAELALRSYKTAPGFEIELFAAEPLLAHPVAFTIDAKNRFYVAESFRVGEQVTDIRRHMHWLNEELASTNTASWRRMVEKHLGDRGDFMTSEEERIRLIEDRDGDGKADHSTVFADGFNDELSGIAAGVLVRKGDVYFTCIPDLWKLEDTNGDGRADERESLLHGFAVRFGFYGHDLHGLRFGPDGKLYFSIGDRGFNVVNQEGERVAGPEMGAVFRCNPDGSEFEIFHQGLRNPQELAFDNYGNLFTGDNNSDGGDRARWVYLVEGGDSGWRIGWQFINSPVPRGPWNAERMWQPENPEQPAYIVPPLLNFANGPSGLTFNPGTGLPPEYDRHFLMCDFRGNPATSLIHSFAVVPKGASFQVTDIKPFVSHILATDVEFGMDGAIYISDWVEGWGKTGKGRLYRVFHPEARANPQVAQVRELMAEGFDRRSPEELASLLAFPDQRVRQEAQFELAERGAGSVPLFVQTALEGKNQLARLHAIWGLGQIQRDYTGQRRAPVRPLVRLLSDEDPEVRAQAAKVLGNARFQAAAGKLARLTRDTAHPRVQFFAAMALGKIGGRAAGPAIVEMLRANDDEDPYLRHAGVMGLHYLDDAKVIEQAAEDDSAAVRMAALLALRREQTPALAEFLSDEDPKVVLEAARAIYDLTIDPAMPKLAALITAETDSEPLLRRVVNAHLRVGTPDSARALAQFATKSDAPEGVRLEALEILGDWEEPSGRDRVTGLWRPVPQRDAATAAAALEPVLNDLLKSGSEDIQAEAAQLAGQFDLRGAAEVLVALAKSDQAASRVRIEAIQSLGAFNHPSLPELLDIFERSPDEALRKESSALLARINPEAAVQRLMTRIASASTGEKQAALIALGTLKTPAATQALASMLNQLLAGKVNPAIQLELLEAAAANNSPELDPLLKQYAATRPQTEIGPFIECLAGGSAESGRKIFFERVEASCTRCHKVGGQGGEAGPALDSASLNRAREHLLESMVAPNKVIAPGFENVIIRLKNGISYAGTLKSETDSELVLNSPEDGVVKIQKSKIETRARGGSGMPGGLPQLLSKRDLRDLVEFLATLI